MDPQVIDNFLPEETFKKLKSMIYKGDFPWFYHPTVVGYEGEFVDCENHEAHYLNSQEEDNLWNVYATHLFYNNDMPFSKLFQPVYGLFVPKFHEMKLFKSLIRIKANLYPYNDTLREHARHMDYPYPHKAAIFSLNTCDGFTRLEDGTKVDSVENRILLFDASKPHNSTNTTTSHGRYNINFNFL